MAFGEKNGCLQTQGGKEFSYQLEKNGTTYKFNHGLYHTDKSEKPDGEKEGTMGQKNDCLCGT